VKTGHPMPLVAPVITATLPSSRPLSPPVAIGSINIPASRRQGKRACSIVIARRFVAIGRPEIP